jgi:sterol desaturase/sphingolipid hydroxylase (fatty acid hydroxylase superfamily)
MIRDVFIGVALAGVGLLLLEAIFHANRPRPLRRLITPNVLVDYCFCVFNLLVIGGLSGLALAALNEWFRQYVPWSDLRLLDGQPMAVQCAVTFLATDFLAYVSHWIRHRVEWLWLFHATHHSQEQLNPLTNLRSHAVDQIVHRMFHAVPLFVLGGDPVFWFWFGGIDSLWGYFVHADVRINLGPLRYILVSPQYHRIHHSLEKRHWDKNFGDRLVIWDYLFGTRYAAADEYPDTGIEGYPVREHSYHPWRIVRNLVDHTVYPFQMLSRYNRARFAPVQPAARRDEEAAYGGDTPTVRAVKQ